MTVKHLYPDVEPSLNLDFANTKRLDPRITFSRSSTATYVGSDGLIKTAPINGARFDHDPETGDSLGLLIEEARTNLLKYSDLKNYLVQAFTNSPATWTAATNPPGGVTINVTSQGNELGPDGLANVTKIAPNVGWSMDVGTPRIGNGFYNSIGFTGNNNITSVYFKPAGCDTLIIQKGNYSTSNTQYTFNTSNMSHNGSSFTYVGNGWYRAATAGDARQVVSFGCSKSGGGAYNGIDGVLLWGAQLEDNVAFPTSYIPTAGATVTRAADVAQITGANFSSWYHQGAGSFIATADRVNGLPVSQFTVMTTDGFRLPEFLFTSSGNARVFNNLTGSYTSPTPLLKASFGCSFDGSGISRYVNGAGDSVSSTSLIDSNTTLYLGNWLNNATLYRLSGHISRLAYYPVRLPDATLQALTL